jgi:ring-1,2-phenylacetyl-CoA epoxidase subunit PaaD
VNAERRPRGATLRPHPEEGASKRVVLLWADVWRALEEIPDPEIPVISIVDLGVVADVRVGGGRVEVDFTPTFMGCPALEVMRARMEDAIRALGAEPDVRVVLDDSWSTDRISTEGREKLRAAGFAPPAPRSTGTPTLVQLERGPFRCPWCGSTDTRLDNVFGPTPCRSLRYCNACRQPFEQFKTV